MAFTGEPGDAFINENQRLVYARLAKHMEKHHKRLSITPSGVAIIAGKWRTKKECQWHSGVADRFRGAYLNLVVCDNSRSHLEYTGDGFECTESMLRELEAALAFSKTLSYN